MEESDFLSHRWLLHNLQDGRYEEKAACKKISTFRKLSTTVESITGRYFLDWKIAHPEQHFAASLFSMRIDFRVIFLAGRLYLSNQGNHWRNTRRAFGSQIQIQSRTQIQDLLLLRGVEKSCFGGVEAATLLRDYRRCELPEKYKRTAKKINTSTIPSTNR